MNNQTVIEFDETIRQRLLELLRESGEHQRGTPSRREHAQAIRTNREIDEIRAELVRRLARQRGWTVGRKPFDLSELIHGRRYRQALIGAIHFPEIDHPDYFRQPTRPYKPAAVLSHSYAPPPKLVAFANRHGLAVEFLAWSWYLPGGCTAALLTRRGDDEDLF